MNSWHNVNYLRWRSNKLESIRNWAREVFETVKRHWRKGIFEYHAILWLYIACTDSFGRTVFVQVEKLSGYEVVTKSNDGDGNHFNWIPIDVQLGKAHGKKSVVDLLLQAICCCIWHDELWLAISVCSLTDTVKSIWGEFKCNCGTDKAIQDYTSISLHQHVTLRLVLCCSNSILWSIGS